MCRRGTGWRRLRAIGPGFTAFLSILNGASVSAGKAVAVTMWRVSITSRWRSEDYEQHAAGRRLEYDAYYGSSGRKAPRGVYEATRDFDQQPRAGTARAGHPRQRDRQRASRDSRGHGIAIG